jgi:hypothetical protein
LGRREGNGLGGVHGVGVGAIHFSGGRKTGGRRAGGSPDAFLSEERRGKERVLGDKVELGEGGVDGWAEARIDVASDNRGDSGIDSVSDHRSQFFDNLVLEMSEILRG